MDALPVRRIVLYGLALTGLVLLRTALVQPFEPMRLLAIPLFVPVLVVTTWAFGVVVRGIDRIDLTDAVVELLLTGGILLASASLFVLVVFASPSESVLPATLPTASLVGFLMAAVSLVPGLFAGVARHRAMRGWRGAAGSVLWLLVALGMIALFLRVLAFGPLPRQ